VVCDSGGARGVGGLTCGLELELQSSDRIGVNYNPLLTVTGGEICLCSRSWEMWDIVARGVNFGMPVAYMVRAEQRAIETVGSTCISVK
jgi:hypothetical protein